MARRRRNFGTVKPQPSKTNPKYWEASYPTPVDYMDRYPNQPRRQCKTFHDPVQADGWLAAEKRLIDGGVWTPLGERRAQHRRATVTFGEYAPDWVENRRRADGNETASGTKIKRRELLKNHLLPTFGHMRLADITPTAIDKWLDGYPKDSQSAYNAYTLLKPIMQSAATEPIDEAGHTLIERNPCVRRMSRPPKKHKTVVASLPQLKALYDRMPEHIALAVYLGGVLGLRIGEVLALRRKDVDVSGLVIHVNATLKPDDGPDGRQVIVRGDPKTRNSTRDIPIPDSLLPMITEHLAKHTGKPASAYLFTGRSNTEPMKENTFNSYFRMARAGVPGLEDYWTHDGRHNALSRDAELGASNALLKALGGHSDIRTVSVYQDATSEQHKAEVMGRLDTALAESLGETDPEPSVSATPSPADDDTAELVSVLAAMPLDSRLAVLRGMDVGRRSQVVAMLPQAAQIETLTALLS